MSKINTLRLARQQAITPATTSQVGAVKQAAVDADLTDSGGGTADGTVASMAPPAALTEDSGAIGGTNDGDLLALVDPSGDSGASVIAGIRENATKINAIITLLGTYQDNMKELTTEIADLKSKLRTAGVIASS